MIMGVTHAYIGPIWYHSKDGPYSANQFLGLDFFCRFLQQTGFSFLRHDMLRAIHILSQKPAQNKLTIALQTFLKDHYNMNRLIN